MYNLPRDMKQYSSAASGFWVKCTYWFPFIDKYVRIFVKTTIDFYTFQD